MEDLPVSSESLPLTPRDQALCGMTLSSRPWDSGLETGASVVLGGRGYTQDTASTDEKVGPRGLRRGLGEPEESQDPARLGFLLLNTSNGPRSFVREDRGGPL